MWFSSKKKLAEALVEQQEVQIKQAHDGYMKELEAAKRSAQKVNKLLQGQVTRDIVRAFGGKVEGKI